MNDIATRFISMLRENIDTDKGQAIIMKMLGEMNSSRQDVIAEECEGMVMFQNYLSENESRAIMGKFVNFDGSRGAHWKDADSAFRAISALGIESEKAGEYNRWAFLTVMRTWFGQMNGESYGITPIRNRKPGYVQSWLSLGSKTRTEGSLSGGTSVSKKKKASSSPPWKIVYKYDGDKF